MICTACNGRGIRENREKFSGKREKKIFEAKKRICLFGRAPPKFLPVPFSLFPFPFSSSSCLFYPLPLSSSPFPVPSSLFPSPFSLFPFPFSLFPFVKSPPAYPGGCPIRPRSRGRRGC